jgi:hypothetical protein
MCGNNGNDSNEIMKCVCNESSNVCNNNGNMK